MVNKNYQRGYWLERKVVNEFRKTGWFAIRSAGSHSQVDVIASNKKEIFYVQLKRVKTKYFNFDKDIQELTRIECPDNVKKELWVWQDFQPRNKKWMKIQCN